MKCSFSYQFLQSHTHNTIKQPRRNSRTEEGLLFSNKDIYFHFIFDFFIGSVVGLLRALLHTLFGWDLSSYLLCHVTFTFHKRCGVEKGDESFPVSVYSLNNNLPLSLSRTLSCSNIRFRVLGDKKNEYSLR
jgi:hypothetical protein